MPRAYQRAANDECGGEGRRKPPMFDARVASRTRGARSAIRMEAVLCEAAWFVIDVGPVIAPVYCGLEPRRNSATAKTRRYDNVGRAFDAVMTKLGPRRRPMIKGGGVRPDAMPGGNGCTPFARNQRPTPGPQGGNLRDSVTEAQQRPVKPRPAAVSLARASAFGISGAAARRNVMG